MEIPELVPGPFGEITLSGQLEVIKNLLRGEEAVVMGSSMGGYLAALYASRHPEVRGAVLLAPAFGLAQRWLESLPAEKVDKWRTAGSLPFFHYVHQRDMRVSYRLIEDGLQYEEEPEVRQPVLIFHGQRDDVVPSELSAAYAATRPNVELHVVDSDHQLTDMVEPMWRRVREFVNGLRDGGVA